MRLISNRNTKNVKRAVLSVGTNSTRLLVASLGGQTRVLEQRSIGTRLGEALHEAGNLGEEPMRRTLEALESHYKVALRYTEHISVIATSAMRRADNAQYFIDRMGEIARTDVTILSGQEEAACSFRGAACFYDGAVGQRLGVVDIGGGSTEYATGTGAVVEKTVSCEIGAVRLTEWFPSLAGNRGFVDNKAIDDARTHALELLSPLQKFNGVTALIAVGGTATTAAAVVRGHRIWFHPSTVSRERLRTAFNGLCELPLDKRKKVPGILAQRADILPAGMLILDVVLELLNNDSCAVSRNDLLLGYLLSSAALPEV